LRAAGFFPISLRRPYWVIFAGFRGLSWDRGFARFAVRVREMGPPGGRRSFFLQRLRYPPPPALAQRPRGCPSALDKRTRLVSSGRFGVPSSGYESSDTLLGGESVFPTLPVAHLQAVTSLKPESIIGKYEQVKRAEVYPSRTGADRPLFTHLPRAGLLGNPHSAGRILPNALGPELREVRGVLRVRRVYSAISSQSSAITSGSEASYWIAFWVSSMTIGIWLTVSKPGPQ
jgi:hypothetical protein